MRHLFLLLILLLAGCASRAPEPLPARDPAAAAEVLTQALSLVGTPYRWGGNTPQSGFDCSGLIVWVYWNAAGIRLPRTTVDLLSAGRGNVAPAGLRGGDLVFFATSGKGKVTHAGIYVGDNRFVHAPRSGGVVRLEYLSSPYWSTRFLAGRRVLD